MGKTLYIESTAGISGDMFVAALLDLGADEEVLKAALESLPLTGFKTVISRKTKSGIDVCDFDVRLDEAHENHDHDMEYLYGHLKERGGHHHHHEHRGLKEVTEIINAATLTDGARGLALRIFDILAEAEAGAHNATKETVHFHEVGAVDSIVDIVAAAVCFDNLDVDRVILPRLTEGQGTIRCAHGILPVPVPAVSAILAAHPIPLSIMPLDGEFVTPTGAAIAAAIMTDTKLPEIFTMKRAGIGGGKREYARPSMLRIVEIDAGESEAPAVIRMFPNKELHSAGKKDATSSAEPAQGTAETKDVIVKLESDIDDTPPEELGYLMELLYAAGAREVHYHPVFMKKSRPATELTVICSEEDAAALETIIFEETTTIGIRKCRMERRVLPRKAEIVETEYGIIAEKTGPHFALGDTCYSYAEDVPMFNPDGKEVVARDNSCSILRKTEPDKAYFNCHTDITIPFEELAEITVVTAEGEEYPLIKDGLFVAEGTEELNEPLLAIGT